jgi:C1A family cysteine protease
MKAVVALLALVALVSAAPSLRENEYQSQFVDFMREFGKSYTNEDFFQRYNTFKYWVDFVADHNAKNMSWTAGINEFSDMTPVQFEEVMLRGLRYPNGMPENAAVEELADPVNDVDWRSKGAVTPVKNQGQCGSCWAFSTTGTVEGFVAIKTGKLPNLAEQQLVDCCKQGGCSGCRGGLPSAALKWVASNGLCSQSDYPYTARDGQCKKTCTAVAKISSSQGGQRGESTLQSALDKVPVSIAVDASGGFQSYKSGVFSGPCGTSLNHAITAVGYTGQYWIVKNSWGTSWGSAGYIFMARGKNLCGLSNDMSWPTA